MKPESPIPVKSADELIYSACYAPTDVGAMLESADRRSRIRRLPIAHLYYGVKEFEAERMALLAPHVTAEQWMGLLDLDLWKRDRINAKQFLLWQRHILSAEDPVARKLIRAVDEELWKLALRGWLDIYCRNEDGEFDGSAPLGREFIQTPDGNFLLVLPKQPEASRLVRQIVLRLYELDEEQVALMLSTARLQTATELEEEAYSNRKRRLEDQGFQDYFEAIEIYTTLEACSALPQKDWDAQQPSPLLPAARLPRRGRFLLLQALAGIESPEETRFLLEELFFVCNKLLSADRVPPSQPERVKRRIRKALAGISLGLDAWSKGRPALAVQGVRKHYLKHFFQIGYGLVIDLQTHGRSLDRRPEPGSFEEAFLEGLLMSYPLRTLLMKNRIRRRFFCRLAEVEEASRKASP